MEHPVFAADGYTYERRNIEDWLKTTNESPITKEVFPHRNLIPNHQLHGEIEVRCNHYSRRLCVAHVSLVQSWKELNEAGPSKADTEVVPLVAAARKGTAKVGSRQPVPAVSPHHTIPLRGFAC